MSTFPVGHFIFVRELCLKFSYLHLKVPFLFHTFYFRVEKYMNKDSSLSGFVGMFKGGRPCGGTPEGGSVQTAAAADVAGRQTASVPSR